jgi:hypothetical protein
MDTPFIILEKMHFELVKEAAARSETPGCQIVYFQTKISILVNLGGSCN